MWFGLPPIFCSGHRAQSSTCPKGGGRPQVGLPLGCRHKQHHERPQITHGNRDRPRYHAAASPGSKLDMAQRGWTAHGRPCGSKQAPRKAGRRCLHRRYKTVNWWRREQPIERERAIATCRLRAVGRTDGERTARWTRNCWGFVCHMRGLRSNGAGDSDMTQRRTL